MGEQSDYPLAKKPPKSARQAPAQNPPLIMDQSFPIDLEMTGEPLRGDNADRPRLNEFQEQSGSR